MAIDLAGFVDQLLGEVWFELTFLLVVALFASFLFARFGQPKVIAYIVVGVVIGPSFLNIIRVEGGASWRPAQAGLHFIRAGRDTIGLVAVNPDPRESQLARASDDDLATIWPDARVVDLDTAPATVFSAGARGDLRLPLLVMALMIGLLEATLAGWRRRAA